MNNLFESEIEDTAIERIQKFARIADKMGFTIALGFSGGKDSSVVYDLCKRAGVPFQAYFNHCFESQTTMNFIREVYPEVIFRRSTKEGFIRNIEVNNQGMLPSTRQSYCCYNYKHNPKNVDACSITGVRRGESPARRSRTTISLKNKRTLKNNKALVNEYFQESCQSIGTSSVIQLLPIVDWSEEDVWNYIRKYDLPINPEYKYRSRVGCMLCPMTDLNTNHIYLLKYPKMIDAFIKARERGNPHCDWIIKGDGIDYKDNKCEYICRWLNRSFSPFSNRHKQLYALIQKAYDDIHNSIKQ